MSKLTSIGIIGVGKMGEALIRGLHASSLKGRFTISGSVKRKDRAKDLGKKLGIDCSSDNVKLAKSSDIIILSVKPHQAKAVLEEISPTLTSKQILISICASITNAQLRNWGRKKVRILRAMPNLPCLIGEGMTVISPSTSATDEDIALAQDIFSAMGKSTSLEESLLDGVTALSACGPAFIFLIIEALSEAGVKVGIPRDVSVQLAAQTMKGSAQMVLQGAKHPAALKDEVTTPAGCTIDGLMALEDGKLRATLIKAVLASTARSASLRGE